MIDKTEKECIICEESIIKKRKKKKGKKILDELEELENTPSFITV